jgi:hypothetical protein
MAGLMVRLTAEVAGVVAVTDELTWEFDDSELVRSRGYTFGDPEHLMLPGKE